MTTAVTKQTSLAAYAGRRVLQLVPMLFVVVTVVFVLIQLAPGDPTTAFTGDVAATPQYLAEVRERYALDKPVLERYWIYLQNLAQGDLGYSLAKRDDVASVLWDRMGPTALLTGSALIGAAILGVAGGVFAGRRPFSKTDNVLSVVAVLGYSIPVFWLAQLMLMFFAVWLGWLPSGGMRSIRDPGGFLAEAMDVGLHLILPATALAIRFFIVDMRITRASIMEVLQKDYITMAHAKGQTSAQVLVRHALPNAMLPVVTVIGVDVGTLLTGSALVEIIFSWPGVGSLLLESTNSRDYPMLMGIFLVMAIAAVIANLITDVIYGFLDPRIRY